MIEREYRIVCYAGFAEGLCKGQTFITTPCLPYDIPICHTLSAAKWQLKEARKCFSYRPSKEYGIYQFGLHIQYRDIPEWKTLKS